MPRPVLRPGDQGDAVEELTRRLVERDHLDAPRRSFDRAVRQAVKEFQSRHVDSRGRPLVVDGVVGPLTWWALEHPDHPPAQVEIPAEVSRALPAGGTPRGRAALDAALAEMAHGAMEVGANNSGPWVTKYLNRMVDPPANWCAAFVSWCFSRHPDGCPYPYSLGAREIREKFRQRGWLYEVSGEDFPWPGDIIVWWRDQPSGWKGHIGFVHRYENGIVYTIEGNKGGFPAPVRIFDYVLGRIDRLLGFGRVP